MSEAAKIFWQSDKAKDYPNRLSFDKRRDSWEPGDYQRKLIGKTMRDMG